MTSKMQLPLLITVTDNGAGVPDELMDHLFDAFVTSKLKGTGFKPALVAKMINDHSGVIEFDSVPRKNHISGNATQSGET